MRALGAACCLALAVACFAGPASAQTSHPVTVDFIVASTTIDRTSVALSTATAVMSRTADIGLATAFEDRVKPRDKVAIAARLAKLVLLDIPIVHFAAGLNHEAGHMTWARQEGSRLDFRLNGGPWSSHAFDLRCEQPGARLGLGTYGGGFDAEFVLEGRTWNRIDQEGHGSLNDAVFLLDGAVGRFYYIQQSLSGISGWAPDDLGYSTGDPTRYVYGLVAQRDLAITTASVLATARSVKRHSWLNFADFALWGQAANLVHYVASGREAFSPWWLTVKGVGLAPFARYHLSPVGPQTEIGSHYRVGHSVGDVSVRWTESTTGTRLVGTSVSWAATNGTIVNPDMRADVWRDVTLKHGVSAETGITAVRWPSPRAALRLSVGAKSDGYVLGLPMRATMFGEIGLRVRF